MARAPKLPQIDTEERFLAQVAWAYHVEGLTQEKVAAKRRQGGTEDILEAVNT